ncbi:MAG: right-handed parallel beta-helix repeat-containing protein [Myxococcota bacterium]|nr:right-handed parallel beta-helix repeat-containing protein [Myxococcota bacterium]
MRFRRGGVPGAGIALRGQLLLALGVLAASAPTAAGDGVFEINQVCATTTGCFPGDDPGFPVTITGASGATGSYRLTGNLTTLSPAQNAIQVSRAGARVDLGGFTITCFRVGFPGGPCEPGSGSGAGVAVVQDAFRNVSVRNGRIFHMAGDGVSLGDGARVEQVDAQENGRGIRVGAASIVRESTATFNGSDGIAAGRGSVVLRNLVAGNGNDGIDAGSAVRVAENSAVDNDDDGIVVGSGSIVSGNVVSGSGDDGIKAGFRGSFVSQNTVSSNAGDGIVVSVSGSVRDNSVDTNGGFQLSLGASVAYGDNSIDGASTVFNGTDTGGNVCNGGPCP